MNQGIFQTFLMNKKRMQKEYGSDPGDKVSGNKPGEYMFYPCAARTVYIVPLGLEGAKLPLCKVAV